MPNTTILPQKISGKTALLYPFCWANLSYLLCPLPNKAPLPTRLSNWSPRSSFSQKYPFSNPPPSSSEQTPPLLLPPPPSREPPITMQMVSDSFHVRRCCNPPPIKAPFSHGNEEEESANSTAAFGGGSLLSSKADANASKCIVREPQSTMVTKDEEGRGESSCAHKKKLWPTYDFP